MATYKLPIWKDTTYQASSGNSPFEYTIDLKTGRQITVNGVTSDEILTVFHGKAWLRPGDNYIYVNINKICQDYLTSSLPDLRNINATTTYTHPEAFRPFYLKDSGGTTINTYNFLLDWSYKDKTLTSDTNLSNPVNGHGCPNMFFLSTKYVNSSQSVVTTISVSPSSGYDNTHCGRYALYYLSRSGGWCSYLFEGNAVKSDKYNRYNIAVPYNTGTLEFGKKTYHNEITTNYLLYTGWMTDEESANFAENVIGTNMAYLHDLETNEIMPVLSVDGTANYKTFKNQGRKPYSYSVNFECSQTKHNIT